VSFISPFLYHLKTTETRCSARIMAHGLKSFLNILKSLQPLFLRKISKHL
jgi:hypothetical protein